MGRTTAPWLDGGGCSPQRARWQSMGWGGLQHPGRTEEGTTHRELGGRAPWGGLQHPGMSEEGAPCRELTDSDPSVITVTAWREPGQEEREGVRQGCVTLRHHSTPLQTISEIRAKPRQAVTPEDPRNENRTT